MPAPGKNAWENAIALDKENGDTLWQDSIIKEIASLDELGCFSYRSPKSGKPEGYQYAPLHIVFDVKPDLRRKSRLVANGAVIDAEGLSFYSSVVKGVSSRLLDVIAHRDGLSTLCGDVSNAFVTAKAVESVFSRAGPEFQDREDSILVIEKALYGLRGSSRAFRAHFADFLKGLGFSATRYDRDVWIRLREDDEGYDYICTHVDDFKIVARDPERWMTQIKGVFCIKGDGPPSYYLGNDYTFDEEEQCWVTGCTTYLKEAIRKVEAPDKCGLLYPHHTPLPPECHPEMDESPLLDDQDTRRYQMLIGMAQWAVTIGRVDIAFAVNSLSRFSANPRQGHFELIQYLFGYLKQYPNRRILINSDPMVYDEKLLDEFDANFLEDYPDAVEELPTGLPTPRGRELDTWVFFDADHAHDQKTRRSVTGLITYVGSTPVQWSSKRQGCIATSTYCAEFVAMRAAVEEAIAIRYMLRCLGVPVTQSTVIAGDNLGSIQSAANAHGDLKKKHVAISYHAVREAVAARIVTPVWINSHENFADMLTKSLGKNAFQGLLPFVLY